MKKIYTSALLITALMFIALQPVSAGNGQQTVIHVDHWKPFYKHVMGHIAYPQKAVEANLQGNSLILFTIAEGGKLKELKVEAELGLGCDMAIINAILSYPSFKDLKIGKYALTALFSIDERKAEIKNRDLNIPLGYTQLEKLTITSMDVRKEIALSTTAKQNKSVLNEPLIVMNGNIVGNSSFKDIAPATIESFTILKHGSALDQYGDMGKNGVIVITTKEVTDSSKSSKSSFTINWRGAEQANAPIYVLDDQIVDNINTLDPNKIDHITLIKDASAVAQYGDMAKNGAMIIYTKKETGTSKPNQIIIKGSSSISPNNPMYIVNDEVIEDIKTIDPNKIDHISIIKDASAVNQYGDMAKNGVIVITTKKEPKQENKP